MGKEDGRLQEMSLKNSTVQDIQLELIRRTRFNAFDGERVVKALLANRSLWQAVMMDRFCFSKAGSLPGGGLIKLRDLPDNIWNVDSIYILTPNAQSAQQLAQIAEGEGWGGDIIQVFTNPEVIDNALGGAEDQQSVVSIWWD